MRFSILAVATLTGLLSTVSAVPVADSGDLLQSRGLFSKAKGKTVALAAHTTGQSLLDAHKKLGTDSTKWSKAKASQAYGDNYTPSGDAQFKSGPLNTHNQTYVNDLLKSNGIEVEEWKTFNVSSKASKPKSKKGKQLPVLVAAYSDDTIVIQSRHSKSDYNKKANKLPLHEVLYQGAKETSSKPSKIIRTHITSKTTTTLINEAIKKTAKGKQTVTLKPDGDKDNKYWFTTILGSGNGKLIMKMLNAHPTYFEGKSVTQIDVNGEKGKQSLVFTLGK